MEDIITEELIMQRTFSNLLIFQVLSMLTQRLAVGALMMYSFIWLGREYHNALAFGITLLSIACVFFILFYKPYPFIRFESFYAARDVANKCLDLLRLETLNGPNRTSYSSTYGSCTAILRLRLSGLAVADHALVAERMISDLESTVAARDFMGTARFSTSCGNSPDDSVHPLYASLHCTKSWGGIARWIAKWQLRDSIANRTQDIAPSEATPLLMNQKS